MFYKKIVLVWINLIIIVIGSSIAMLYIVDPVGIWNTPIIYGINNYKIKQSGFLDISKPYQYIDCMPKNVFIGSSRVYVGLYPNEKDNSYNMGMSSLSIPDMHKYINFMCKTNPPEKIFIGLDFFQFSKKNYYLKREGFSDKRLTNIANERTTFGLICLKIKDSMPYFSYIKNTLSESSNKKSILFERGADIGHGLSEEINKDEYYHFINSFIRQYSEWEYEPKAVEELKQIIEYLGENNIQVVVFFNPITIDLYNILDETQRMSDFYKVKKNVAKIVSFYDFARVSDITTNRELFYDSSHYKMQVGDEMQYIFNEKIIDENKVFLCNENNIEQILFEENKLFKTWADENINYKNYLNEKIRERKEVANNELVEYIGF